MVDVAEIKACMARKNMTQTALAYILGITPKTLHNKMKKGVFGSDEMEVMIEALDITDPAAIFFAHKVT